MRISISSFHFPKNAQIFKIKTPLSKTAVEKIFIECSKNKTSNFIIDEVKTSLNINGNTLIYSCKAFALEQEPSFLLNTKVKETKYAFLLLIEYNNYLFVFKRNIDSFQSKIQLYIEPIEYGKFTSLKAKPNAKYERISMKSMTVSDMQIRNRSFEGRNIDGILPTNSASRSIPNNFRLNVDGEIYLINPNTSRLALRSQKSSLDDLAEWCLLLTQELNSITPATINSFIKSFAAPIKLEQIKSTCSPTAILFHLEELDINLRDSSSPYKLISKENQTEVEIKEDKELNNFFELFRSPLNLRKIPKSDVFSIILKGQDGLGEIKLNKIQITFKSKVGENILIKTPTETISLSKFINSQKNFSVVFDTPNYMYVSRYTFKDKQLLNNIEGMMSVFDDSMDFSDVVSEKEKPFGDNTITEFPDKSLFYAVENNFIKKDEIVICDDMGNEWADHIIFSTELGQPTISFIHSKYTSKDTYGASSFHEVVSQALKNLGRLNSELSEYKKKYDNKWKNNYESTSIKRIRTNNNWSDIKKAYNKVNSTPNSNRKVILATPFFSKSKLKDKLEKIANGTSKNSHHIQIIWLINSFISSCRDYNVQPHILCKK
ncbi:hypothetical protein [Aureispira anguillae]|uniref:Uncharacterized protein n=1 Tax=Aureispira anguillae TaxID=2864201 RepID=A0A915YD06_9BACT|nr:hypothetical protein [Aureispira anguillae]BDS10829.1 hypothetical protein AsAng_0015390 [Aureispira anguillae]